MKKLFRAAEMTMATLTKGKHLIEVALQFWKVRGYGHHGRFTSMIVMAGSKETAGRQALSLYPDA